MADVSANLKDWSTTVGSNAPTDATVIGAGLADNFQQIQATVRGDLASKGADIASAATTDLGAVVGLMHDITGTVTITSFGTVAAGIWKIVKFEGALTLTHNATSLILPGGQNITTVNGDVGIFMSEGSGNWRCLSYLPTSNSPDGALTSGRVPFATTGGKLTDDSGFTFSTSGDLLSVGGVVTTLVQHSSLLHLNLTTSDGSDNGEIRIGIVDETRGAYARLFGNESAATGQVQLSAGNVTGGEILFSTAAAVRMRVGFGGAIFVNDTSNGDMTIGLTLNQSSNDDDILAFKSSDVAHGVTSRLETDSFAIFRKSDGDTGGLLVRTATESNRALYFEGICTTEDATRSTAAEGVMRFDVRLKSGTTVAATTADRNMIVFSNGLTTRFIFDSDGDSHQDVGTAWTNFDAHNDLEIMDALAVSLNRDDPLKTQFVRSLEDSRSFIENLPGKPLVTFNDDGHHFMCTSRFVMLHHGAIRQIGRAQQDDREQIAALTARCAMLESQLARLEARNA